MFRIQRQNVKIAEGVPTRPPEDKRTEEAATEIREQPSLSMPREEAEALLQAARQAAGDLVAAAQEQAEEITRAAEAVRQAAREEAEALLQAAGQAAEAAEAAGKEQAADLLAGAQAMAEGILQDARALAEQEGLDIRGQAWQAGHQEGLEVGRQEVLEAGRLLAADVQTLVEGLEAGRAAQMARLEGDVIELALGVARKVLGVAIDREDKMYKALIQNALSQMKREGKLLIRLSQQTAGRLFPDGVATFTLGDQRVTATISADPFMKNHDVALESDSETVTAGLDSQLAAIVVAFESAAREE